MHIKQQNELMVKLSVKHYFNQNETLRITLVLTRSMKPDIIQTAITPTVDHIFGNEHKSYYLSLKCFIQFFQSSSNYIHHIKCINMCTSVEFWC